MKDQLSEIVIIVGWVVFGCAVGVILTIDLYQRYYKNDTPNVPERQESLDQSRKLNEEAGRLRREISDDIAKTEAKINNLQKAVDDNPDFDDAEFDRRVAQIRRDIDAIKTKSKDADTLMDQSKHLIDTVKSYSQ